MQIPAYVDNAISALEIIDLTQQKYVPAGFICQKTKISKTYLTAIMSRMSKAGIVGGKRGRVGGYCRLRQCTAQELFGIMGSTWTAEANSRHKLLLELSEKIHKVMSETWI